jgi:hypothetical protein
MSIRVADACGAHPHQGITCADRWYWQILHLQWLVDFDHSDSFHGLAILLLKDYFRCKALVKSAAEFLALKS